MVFNDVTRDYEIFTKILTSHSLENGYIDSALELVQIYHAKISTLADTFLKSPKGSSDQNSLIRGLNSLENAFSSQIAAMNIATRNAALLITEIEQLHFVSVAMQENTALFCSVLNSLMDITDRYAANKILNKNNSETFFQLIEALKELEKIHTTICNNADLLYHTELELLEAPPAPLEESASVTYLDIRSLKTTSDLSSFSNDIHLLSESLQGLERLVAPAKNHTIFIRKIESGSLKALFGSSQIDFSIFPDLITSMSGAIKTWRVTPCEKEKVFAEIDRLKAETDLIQAQAEAQHIQNEGSKMAIVSSQIDYLCDKLNLDADDPECIEQIQKFCLPLITYIEHNPVGIINGVEYDISKEVRLLEEGKK